MLIDDKEENKYTNQKKKHVNSIRNYFPLLNDVWANFLVKNQGKEK